MYVYIHIYILRFELQRIWLISSTTGPKTITRCHYTHILSWKELIHQSHARSIPQNVPPWNYLCSVVPWRFAAYIVRSQQHVCVCLCVCPTLKSATAPKGFYRTIQKVLSNPIWPLKRFYRTPTEGPSEPQTRLYRTLCIEPPLFSLSF